MEYIILIIGFVLLIKGADFFVEGSSSVAKQLRVPSMIIGLTIVAMVHHLGLWVDHRVGRMIYIGQDDDVRLVVQLNIHSRVETTGEEVDLGQLGQVVAYVGESFPFELTHTLLRAEDLASPLQFEGLNETQRRVRRVEEDADFFSCLVITVQ